MSLQTSILELLSTYRQSNIHSCRELLAALSNLIYRFDFDNISNEDFHATLDSTHDMLVISDYAVRSLLYREVRGVFYSFLKYEHSLGLFSVYSLGTSFEVF